MPKPTTADADEVDTSTNDESQETDSELEDDDEGFDLDEVEDESADASEESETDESEDSEADDANSEDEESEEDADSTEEDSDESEEDADKSAKDEDSEAERKQHNDEAAKKRIADREAKQKKMADEQQDYLDNAENATDLAVRQLQVNAYNQKVLSNAQTLQNGVDKAFAHIDLFKDKSPEVQEALGAALDDFEGLHVVRDKFGEPTEVKADLFEFLQGRAAGIKNLIGVGRRQQGKASDDTRARTLTPPSRTPKKPKTDPDMDGFDDEANKP
jgi:chromosome segregation ATPase